MIISLNLNLKEEFDLKVLGAVYNELLFQFQQKQKLSLDKELPSTPAEHLPFFNSDNCKEDKSTEKEDENRKPIKLEFVPEKEEIKAEAKKDSLEKKTIEIVNKKITVSNKISKVNKELKKATEEKLTEAEILEKRKQTFKERARKAGLAKWQKQRELEASGKAPHVPAKKKTKRVVKEKNFDTAEEQRLEDFVENEESFDARQIMDEAYG